MVIWHDVAMQNRKPDTAEQVVRRWMEGILKKGMSATQWGNKANVSPSTITRFLSGDSESVPSFKTIYSLAQAANASLPGAGDLEGDPVGSKIYLPIYNSPVSAPPGVKSVEQDNKPEYYFQASEKWLREWTNAPIKDIGFMKGNGSVNEPTIYHGELVLVDFSCRKFLGDGIYVLKTVGDILQLKRVIHQHDGYEVRTDNLRYPGFKVEHNQLNVWGKALTVVGRKLD